MGKNPQSAAGGKSKGPQASGRVTPKSAKAKAPKAAKAKAPKVTKAAKAPKAKAPGSSAAKALGAKLPTSAFLSAQRQRLTQLRSHLARRTEKVDRDLGRAEGAEKDFAEQATASENDDVLEALSGEGRDQLALVDEALARIDAGTFGVCAACSKPIPKERLEALPYATSCRSCAAK